MRKIAHLLMRFCGSGREANLPPEIDPACLILSGSCRLTIKPSRAEVRGVRVSPCYGFPSKPKTRSETAPPAVYIDHVHSGAFAPIATAFHGFCEAQCVARSLIMVGDPFLRGFVPMMGVVEVFPEWRPLLAFAVLSVCMCAALDDKRPSHHHPFASTISGVPFDCREHWMPPSK